MSPDPGPTPMDPHAPRAGGAEPWVAGAPQELGVGPTAQTTRLLLTVMVVVAALGTLGTVLVFVNKPLSAALVGLLWAGCAAGWLLHRRGWHGWASGVVCGAWWAVSAAQVSLSGGLRSPGAHLQILAVVAAWTFLGRRGLIVGVGATGLLFLVHFVLWSADAGLPVLLPNPPQTAAFLVVVALGLFAVVGKYTLDNNARAFARALAEAESRRAAEERFRAIFDHTFELAGLLAPDGTLLEANHAALTFINAAIEDVRGRPFWETPWWEHDEGARRRLREGLAAAARGEFVRFETEHVSASGERRSIDFSLVPVRGRDGSVSLIIPEGRDMTDLRRSAAALQRIERVTAQTLGPDFQQTLADELCRECGTEFAMVGEIDAEDPGLVRILAMSRRGAAVAAASYRLEGTPCDRLRGEGLCHIPSGVADAFPRDVLLKEHGIESYMGVPLQTPSGRWIGLIVLMHTGPIANPGSTEALLRVVSARAQAELQRARAQRRLEESEARLAAVVSHSPGVGIQWYDGSARVVLWNPASQRIFGLPADAAMGRTPAELHWSPEQAALFDERLRRVGLTGRPEGPFECEFRRPDGSVGACLSTIFRIPGEHGRHWCVRMDVDLTEQRRLDAELRQSQRMGIVGQLAGGIAHDFNNLLTVINGYSDMLLMEGGASEETWKSAAAVRGAGERASHLTRQLLAFSRKQVIRPVPVDAAAAVRRLEPMLARLLGAEVALVVEARPDDGPAVILIDHGQFEQVIMNLAINARDAMPKGGELRISVQTPGGSEPRVTVKVRDAGTGIPPELRDRIFEPFFTTKPPGTGTGLGLATVLGIVKQSGGEIDLSTALGAGTEFRLTWPRHAGPAEELQETNVGAAPRGSERVLVTDDEPVVREFARSLLQMHGYDAVTAGSAEEALRIAGQPGRPIDLLITDVSMPGMSGRELADRFRAEVPHPARVLFISGYSAETELVGDASTAGAGLLEKPFTPRALLRAVRRVLDGAGADPPR